MKRKTIGMFVCILLISLTILPASGNISVNNSSIKSSITNLIYLSNEEELWCAPSETVEYWAVLVAWPELWYVRGAEQVRRSLIYQGWKEDHIKTLYYENATKANLIEAIDWIVEHEDSWDTTLIYLHDHGGEGFFCLYGGNILYKELDRELDRLKSAAVGVVVDACHSGSVIPPLKQNGRVIITSCKANQSAGSIFDGVANGLNEFADYKVQVGDHNGAVSMEELYDYIWSEDDWIKYQKEPQIQDDCAGALHLTFQNWENGLVDQMPRSTSYASGRAGVILWNNSGTIYDWQSAQSFQPSVDSLTKVRLHVEKQTNNVDSPLMVSIRSELDGEDLTSKTLSPDEVKQGYTTFDFPDIKVTPGMTYYIVCRATEEETNTDNSYLIHDDDDSYEEGMEYYSTSYGWLSHEDKDLCFTTYKKSNDENLPPYVPRRPVGPIYGEKNTVYSYYISTEDVNDDLVYYMFDWGDDTSTNWLGPYESGEVRYENHSWVENGTYNVKVKTKDEQGLENNWSSILRVKIGNERPNKPFIDGPLRGIVGEEYNYKFIATDPNGDDVLYYYVDWGDGQIDEWIGPCDSGESLKLSHTFKNRGSYLISSKAEDIYGGVSECGYLKVIIPKNKLYSFQFNNLVFEQNNYQNSGWFTIRLR